MGGWITIDSAYAQYFSCPISDYDVNLFGVPRGSADGQQIWECLAVLVAMDIWTRRWQQHRIILKVRGDNVGALTLLIKMRPASPTIAIIARDLALRTVELSFPPEAIHTPGVAHVIADKLSRIHAPGGIGHCKDIHPALAMATETPVPDRKPEWYRALHREPAEK